MFIVKAATAFFYTFIYPIYDYGITTWIRKTQGNDAVLNYRMKKIISNVDSTRFFIMLRVREIYQIVGKNSDDSVLLNVLFKPTHNVDSQTCVEVRVFRDVFETETDPQKQRKITVRALQATGDLSDHVMRYHNEAIQRWIKEGA